jgi:post-segregation antitoxin (ccd killing protein)
MAQLNLYVPDELASRLKAEARNANLPLSRYVVNQLTKDKADAWPEGAVSKS